MRIVVAPDKFKGSLPATEVAAAVAAGLRAEAPRSELVTMPVADGGEGTVDAAVAAGFEGVPVTALEEGRERALRLRLIDWEQPEHGFLIVSRFDGLLRPEYVR